MRLKNTSRYADDEVRKLIEFATKGINLTGVAVHVKNTKHSHAGMAYDGVPSISPASRQPDTKYLITLRIGPPSRFPCDTLRDVVRWERITKEEFLDGCAGPNPNDYASAWSRKQGTYYQHRVVTREGYGGKQSPVLQLADWREALVAVAAHEARHIHQYRHRKRRSEVDCERWAAKRLEAYRAEAD